MVDDTIQRSLRRTRGRARNGYGSAMLSDEVQDVSLPLGAEGASWDIDCAGVRYRVYRVGPARGRAVLAVHGFSESACTWFKLARASLDMTLYAVDLVGHGASAAPTDESAYALDAQAQALAQIVQEVYERTVEAAQADAPKEATKDTTLVDSPSGGDAECQARGVDGAPALYLLGYSMGGRLSLYTALTHPLPVRALLLESAGFGISDPEMRAERKAEDEMLAQHIEERGIDWFTRYWETVPVLRNLFSLPRRERLGLDADRRTRAPHALAATLRSVGQGTFPALYEQLPDIPYPVHYLFGALDEKYRDISRAAAQRRILSGRISTVTKVGGAMHKVHLEQPDEFAAWLSYLCDERETWRDDIAYGLGITVDESKLM